MEEYSRIVIQRYCDTHNTVKSRRLRKLLELSYDPGAEYTDADAIYLANAINREKDDELAEAMQDLDDYLCGW